MTANIQKAENRSELYAVRLLALANGLEVVNGSGEHKLFYALKPIKDISEFERVARANQSRLRYAIFPQLTLITQIDPLEVSELARQSGLAFLCNSLVDQLHYCTPQTTSNTIAEIGTELTAALAKLSALTPNSDGTQADRSAEINAFVEALQAPALDQRITALITKLDLFGKHSNPTPFNDPNVAYNIVFELVQIAHAYASTNVLSLARQVDITEALVRFEGTFTTHNPDIRTTQFVTGQATNLIYKLHHSLTNDGPTKPDLVSRYNTVMENHLKHVTRLLTL